MLEPRPYQSAAVDAVWRHIAGKATNPVVALPTGGGKSLVIAMLCRDAVAWGGTVCVLAHRKELISQNAAEIRQADETIDLGIYSAGLGKRELRPVTVAGIQSVYKRAYDFDPIPDIVVIDEAHLVPPNGEGMFRRFLDDCKTANPNVRLVGLTATPYRTATGVLCSPHGLLNEVVHATGVRELIDAGYLCPLISKRGLEVDTSGLHLQGGEFVSREADELMRGVVVPAVAELLAYTQERRSSLVFCQSVAHATRVRDLIRDHGHECELLIGETPAVDREAIIREFQAGVLPYLVNVDVLTTGFNARNVDCVAVMRPTMSAGLWVQMVGRGFRLHDRKADCLVLDFGGNLKRHGPVDAVDVTTGRVPGVGVGQSPVKTCPDCGTLQAAGCAYCRDCGHVFPRKRKQHEHTASERSILSTDEEPEEIPVKAVDYQTHRKRDAPDDHPRTMRVTYDTGLHSYSEWVCVEHTGFARRKADTWWGERTTSPLPRSADVAVDLADHLPTPDAVLVLPNGKYKRIVGYVWPDDHQPVDLAEIDADATLDGPVEDCPFCGFEVSAGCRDGQCMEVPF